MIQSMQENTQETMTGRFDFIAIGDIVNDEFITLRPDQAHTIVDPATGRTQIAMNFGDKLPYDSFDIVNAVGNSPNAAVSAHRLGLKATLIVNCGDDAEGDLMIAALQQEGIDQRFVKRHAGKLSNHHYVLRLAPERTILIKHEEYEYKLPDLESDGQSPKWIYLSSLGENSLPYHLEIAAYLRAHPETKLAFQPGSFQIRLGTETLKDLYAVTEVFFCNKEEAMTILNYRANDSSNSDISVLLKGLKALGPKIPVITDGPNGAYVLDQDGAVWFTPMYPDPAAPVDRTGAGDACASTFTAALILGKTIPEALAWGPINSMSVVQAIGAQKGLLSRQELEKYLAAAPEEYKLQKIG